MSTEQEYNALDGVRRSALWELKKSPAHYLYAVMNPPKETPALAFGSASHKYILETDDFWNEYAMTPECDRRTKDGKAVWNQFQEKLASSGKSPVSFSDYSTILMMNQAILDHPTASELLKTGQHEVTIQWTDPETGEPCKCRVDCLTEWHGQKYIVDYKTTTSCEDGHFERACRTYGYKLQAAMYAEGVFAQTFEQYGFAFVAQEKNPPYAVRVYFCDRGFLDEGRDLFRELIRTYHKCKQAGIWPGYEDKELYGDE